MVVDWLKRVPKFSLAGGIALGLVFLSFVFTTTQVQDATKRNCQQIQLVKARISLVIRQSLGTIGTPDGASYSYYLAHPAELLSARMRLRRELVEFAPDRC